MARAEQGLDRDEGTNRVEDSQGAEQDGGHCRGQNRVEGMTHGMGWHVRKGRAGQGREGHHRAGRGMVWHRGGAWADSMQGRIGQVQ